MIVATYDPGTEQLGLGDTRTASTEHGRREAFGAPLEHVADVGLVSLRDAAKAHFLHRDQAPLVLMWSDYPAEVFYSARPTLEMVWLSSDGDVVRLHLAYYVADRDGYPEDSESAQILVSHSISPFVGQFDAEVEVVEVAPYRPMQLRHVEIVLVVPPQRRTVGELRDFGLTVKRNISFQTEHFLSTPAGVIGVLDFGPTLLIGQVESQWLEAKRQPYDLDMEGQKVELAKDVAAMANAGEGLIVFGFPTRSSPGGDVISRARAIDTGAIEPQRHMQVLRSRIYPMPEGVEIKRTGRGQRGFAYIYVPHQPSELRPFILRETSSRGRVRSSSLSIPVRSGAQTDFDSTESIHSLIVAGRVALRNS